MVNRFTCSNLGDQEIANCYEEFLNENYNIKVIRADYTSRRVTSLNINAPLRMRSIKSVIKKVISPRIVWIINFIRVFREIKKSQTELVLIGGGQLIMPGVFCLAAFTWVLASKLLGTKVIMANVGAGGNFDGIDRWLLRWTMSWLDGISFRDKKSSEIVTSICEKKMPIFILTSDIVYTKSIKQNVSKPRFNFSLAITDWNVYQLNGGSGTRHEYFENWMQLLSQEKKTGDNVILVYATAEDYKETLLFNRFLKENYKYSFEVASISGVADFRYILSTSRILVSGRMHSLLFAAQCNCSLRPFIISDKLKSFYSDLSNHGLENLKQIATLSTLEFLNPFLIK
jgi:polysaccharide pyruvyl transferase WcaK-like protein